MKVTKLDKVGINNIVPRLRGEISHLSLRWRSKVSVEVIENNGFRPYVECHSIENPTIKLVIYCDGSIELEHVSPIMPSSFTNFNYVMDDAQIIARSLRW